MARTPKAAPVPSPAPSPRGRKPREVTAPTPALPGVKGTAGVEDDVTSMAPAPASMPDSAPVQGRAGRRPKVRDAAATPSLIEQALEQQPEPDASQPAAIGDDALIAEMAYPVSAGEGNGVPADGTAPAPPSQNTPTPAKAAARWDRATDTVQFDWPEIERTASQGGPNQVMAKLLVAARAEGANSRWPL